MEYEGSLQYLENPPADQNNPVHILVYIIT